METEPLKSSATLQLSRQGAVKVTSKGGILNRTPTVIGVTMDYRAHGRFPNHRNRSFMDQRVPEPWESRWGFSSTGAARHFARYPRSYYLGLSSMDEYLFIPGNARRTAYGYDPPFRDEYATQPPQRMRTGFFDIFESRSTRDCSHPPPYSQHFGNADQCRTKPFSYSFSSATTSDNSGPRTSGKSASVVYPDSIQEVCILTI